MLRGVAILSAIGVLALSGPAAAQAPVYNWTGFYIGGHLGVAHGNAELEGVREVLIPGFVTLGGIPAPAPLVLVPSRFSTVGGVSGHDTDFLGGIQIGRNWQQGAWVYGIEADLSRTGLNVTMNQNVPDPFLIQTLTGTYSAKIDWLGSLRLRAGHAFDRLLIYATGGLAFVHGKLDSSFTLTNPITGIFFPIPFEGTTSASSAFFKFGWTLGLGAELALGNGWSIAGEYRHFHFGNRSVTLAVTDPGGQLEIRPVTTNLRLSVDQVTARLNWQFGPR